VAACGESTCPMPTLAANGIDELPPPPDPRMCALGFTPSPSETAIARATSCESGACLRVPLEHELPACGNYPPASEGLCTAACQVDADCDALAGPCVTGYTCGVAVTIGPYCCQRLCMCLDYVTGETLTPAPCDPDDPANTCCNLAGRPACSS
ncbi:MAG TPA: hypothetical protein VIV58_08065, partial [Kofleriaceae bacterium]